MCVKVKWFKRGARNRKTHGRGKKFKTHSYTVHTQNKKFYYIKMNREMESICSIVSDGASYCEPHYWLFVLRRIVLGKILVYITHTNMGSPTQLHAGTWPGIC